MEKEIETKNISTIEFINVIMSENKPIESNSQNYARVTQ